MSIQPGSSLPFVAGASGDPRHGSLMQSIAQSSPTLTSLADPSTHPNRPSARGERHAE